MRLELGTIDFLTLALVLVTAYYAWVTRHILKTEKSTVNLMKDQFQAAYRPYVVVSHFLGSDGRIYLRVCNRGQSGAQNLRLSLDADVHQLGIDHENYNLANQKAFSSPIRYFPSGSEITLALREVDYVMMTGQVTLGDDESNAPSTLQFSIRSEYSFGDTSFDETTPIDLTVYDKSFQPSDSIDRQLARIVHELHEINRKFPSQSRDAV